jgi:hypothetical protein
MAMVTNVNDDDKTKTLDITDIMTVINGSLDELKTIDPNQLGRIVDKDSIEKSQTTPIFIIILQNRRDLVERVKVLKSIGGDFDKKINWYGAEMSANEFAKNYNRKIE